MERKISLRIQFLVRLFLRKHSFLANRGFWGDVGGHGIFRIEKSLQVKIFARMYRRDDRQRNASGFQGFSCMGSSPPLKTRIFDEHAYACSSKDRSADDE